MRKEACNKPDDKCSLIYTSAGSTVNASSFTSDNKSGSSVEAKNSSDPELIMSGTLSMYKDFGMFRRRWKACQCRLYSNSLFMCYESLVVEPVLSLHLNPVKSSICVGVDNLNLLGTFQIPRKVLKSDQRLILSIPRKINSSVDVVWIKFLNIESFNQWIAAIASTLTKDEIGRFKGCQHDLDWYRSLKPRMKRKIPSILQTAENGQNQHHNSILLPQYQEANTNLISTGKALVTGAFMVKNAQEALQRREAHFGRGRNDAPYHHRHDSTDQYNNRRSSSVPDRMNESVGTAIDLIAVTAAAAAATTNEIGDDYEHCSNDHSNGTSENTYQDLANNEVGSREDIAEDNIEEEVEQNNEPTEEHFHE